MVLQTLATLGPQHGYTIAARLEQVSGGALRINMGTLYPGLMRLEQRGLVVAEWRVTENNRRARFYRITTAGGRQLAPGEGRVGSADLQDHLRAIGAFVAGKFLRLQAADGLVSVPGLKTKSNASAANVPSPGSVPPATDDHASSLSR